MVAYLWWVSSSFEGVRFHCCPPDAICIPYSSGLGAACRPRRALQVAELLVGRGGRNLRLTTSAAIRDTARGAAKEPERLAWDKARRVPPTAATRGLLRSSYSRSSRRGGDLPVAHQTVTRLRIGHPRTGLDVSGCGVPPDPASALHVASAAADASASHRLVEITRPFCCASRVPPVPRCRSAGHSFVA